MTDLSPCLCMKSTFLNILVSYNTYFKCLYFYITGVTLTLLSMYREYPLSDIPYLRRLVHKKAEYVS